MNNQNTKRAVSWAVFGDMNEAVSGAVDWAVRGAVFRAVDRAVSWDVSGAVDGAVGEDSDLLGLQDFLLSIKGT